MSLRGWEFETSVANPNLPHPQSIYFQTQKHIKTILFAKEQPIKSLQFLKFDLFYIQIKIINFVAIEYQYYVYILSNKKNGTLYIGMTDNIARRIEEHKSKINKDSFTVKYGLDKLVYYESTNNVNEAMAREKQLKNWKREWKIKLIEENNKDWNDLSLEF